MNKIQYLKIAIIFFFLIITYPGGTLTLNIFFWLIVGVFFSVIDLLCFNCDNHIETIKNLIILSSVIISIYFVFNKNKHLVSSSIIIQYLYLISFFKIKFLSYWYYTFPVLIYLILSLILLYFILFKKET